MFQKFNEYCTCCKEASIYDMQHLFFNIFISVYPPSSPKQFILYYKIVVNVCINIQCEHYFGKPANVRTFLSLGKTVERFQSRRKIQENKLCILIILTHGPEVVLTLRTSEAGIPALRKLPCGVRRPYTGFAETSLWRQKLVYWWHSMSTPGVRSRYIGFVF